MKRRSLCGSSQDRCRCAARPDGKRRKPKTTSSIPRLHVALAARVELVRLLVAQVQQDRDVVGAERPQRVLVRAQLAEVEAVRVDVVEVAELAGVGDLLELRDARVVLEQVADHQQPPAALAPRRPRARRRRPCASGFSTKQCLPASSTRSASARVGRDGRGEDDRVELGSSASRSSRSAVKRALGNAARAALARASACVAAPGQLAAGHGGEVAGEVRAPVAEARRRRRRIVTRRILSERVDDALARAAVAVERRALGRRRALQRGERRLGVEVDERVPARVDRLRPLRRVGAA